MYKTPLYLLKVLILILSFSQTLVAQKTTGGEDANITLLEENYKQSIAQKDTFHTIKSLADLGLIYSHRAQYTLAYDKFWTALSMASAYNDSTLLARVYNEIGWLYSFYNRSDEALLYYKKAIHIHKKLLERQPEMLQSVISDYYNFVTLYREMGKPKETKNYLDSCFHLHKQHKEVKSDAYLQAELAYYVLGNKNYHSTISRLETLSPWFEEINPSYLIILNTFLADAYVGIKEYTTSEELYKTALIYADSSHNHSNYIPLIHYKLGELYSSIGKYAKAYKELNTAREIEKQLFDSRSQNNKSILEVLDRYTEEQEAQKEYVLQQELIRLEQERKMSQHRNVFAIIIILFIITFALWSYRSIRAKHRAEKKSELQQRELERQKNKEIFELKNRELTLSTLRLIEKEEQLKDLKDSICNNEKTLNKSDLSKIFKTIKVDHNKNWTEFESRFIDINSDFHKNLTKRFPKLTSNDLKVCALVKLDFSGKEMANLLGIGIESVHTLRYRLRKKLGLSRSENLTQFLNTLD